ncbi:30S ribosomal protein S9 [Candidatus Marinamargulisbacteria bacterium SCGC AAA071-K20]|nr:30S ribosomal protein S9 [Candidatus Marinamargulisbacteria bacterium SCGC AAA071-K20]
MAKETEKKTSTTEIEEKVLKKTKKNNSPESLKVPKLSYYGTGRRKNAIAKTWLFEGTGQVVINKKIASDYLKSSFLTNSLIKPLEKLKVSGKYDIFIRTLGGGLVGQAGACQLGVARALLQLNPSFRPALKEEGFLTRDPRVKERKKYGKKKARKGFQFRKR